MEHTLTFMPESQQSRNGEEEEEEGQWLGKANFQNITKNRPYLCQPLSISSSELQKLELP